MSKLKKILIFQTGEPTHLDKSGAPMRLMNLIDALIKYEYKIEVLTSLFSHQEKKFRNLQVNLDNGYKKFHYTFLDSPGYQNNISLSRFYDHIILAKNLKIKLKEFKNINYVFMGYPPIEACFILARWCKKNNIPYMIDYKDFWPELFTYNKNFLFKILSYPFICILKILRNYCLKNSSSISTISETFLDELNTNYIKNKKIVCYLTKKINQNINLDLVNNRIKLFFSTPKIKIVFIGNFMTDAFDFLILAKIKDFIIKSTNLEFHLFGNGPSKKEVSTYLNFKNIYLHDRVNASEFQYILSNSQAAFLPIKNRFDFLKSIPNKVVDSIQYKLPIFTCLLGETKSIVQKYNLGFIYGDHHDLQDQLTSFCNGLVYGKIKKNYENPELQKIFDHNLNYQKILDKIVLNLKM